MTDTIITGYWDFLWNGSQEIFYPTSLIHNIYHALFHLPDFQQSMLCISFMVILLMHILYGYFTDAYPLWLFYWCISFMVILLMYILYGYFTDAKAFIPFLQIINITMCLHISRDILFIIMGWNCQACNEYSLLWTFKYHTHEAIYSQAA